MARRRSALERIRAGDARDGLTLAKAVAEEIGTRLPEGYRTALMGFPGRDIQVRVLYGDELRGKTWLGNITHRVAGLGPAEAAAAIQEFAVSIATATDPGEAGETILPVVRHAKWIEQMAATGAESPYRALSDDGSLCLAFVRDSPTHVRYVARTEMGESLPDNLPELEALALENLSRYVGDGANVEVGEHRERGDSAAPELFETTVASLGLDGCYESSLVLEDPVLERLLAPPLGDGSSVAAGSVGDFAIAVPARDRLLIADSRSEASVALLSRVACVMHWESSYAISPHLYRLADGDTSEKGPRMERLL